jgi:ATP-dependent Lon protease
MDLKKNDKIKRSNSYIPKKKKKKEKKDLDKQIKEDCNLYLQDLDIDKNGKSKKDNDDYFGFYENLVDNSTFIVKSNSFILNNDVQVFDIPIKNLKNNENKKLFIRNNKSNQSFIQDLEIFNDKKNNKSQHFIEDLDFDAETLKNKKNKNNNENKEIINNEKITKFDDIKNLDMKLNDINEYNFIKTSFKINGENLLNNEINKKYSKKKTKENILITDKLKEIFRKLVNKETKSRPNLSNILLSNNFDDNTKIILLKKYIKYSSEDDYLSEQADKIKLDIENIINKKENIIIDDNEKLTNKIKEKFMPDELKLKLENLNMVAQTSSSNKLQNFINDVLKIPYNIKETTIDILNKNLDNEECKKIFIKNIYEKLNNKLFGLNNVKNSILSYFCLKLNNPNIKNKKFLCLCGPPGVGKTSIVHALSEAIDIPHSYISMANINESSILLGHSYTFEGSIYGSLSSSLINNKCKNGIIIFDELDKCTEKVQKTMLGIFDPLQNNKFIDAYFNDFYLDLSETLMIICVNSVDNLNPYLRDRLHIVNIEGYSEKEKKIIIDNYIIPTFDKEYNIKIDIDSEVINYILRYNNNEKGIRKISTDISKIYELIILDKYMDNIKLNNKFTIKDIGKLNLELSNENKYRNMLYS